MNEIEAKIDQLREELNKHNHNYYVESNPSISDYEFDMKLKELSALETQHPEYFDANSPTQRVGSDITKEFKQIDHKYPMLSLGNTYSEDDIREFYARVRKGLNDDFEIICELKYDGTSISLTYENGELVQAVTRGDGVQGDDVTANVRTIRTIPLRLHGEGYPSNFEIRGEILLPWSVFDRLNAEREELGEQPFANPRNAASGTLKQQDSKVVASRELDAYLYYMLGEELPCNGHYENLEKAKSWGFKTSDATRKCQTLEEVLDFIHYWDAERKNLPVATDGIVLKVNSLVQQKNLGYTSKSPRWAISYKFQAESALTKLLQVSYQVGRTGAITPVANLEPVLLSGSTVRRASLYNEDNIDSLDLHTNDYVSVEKGGEIIPKITAVDLSKRQDGAEKIYFISHCPECGSLLNREEGEAHHYCLNDTGCPPQITGKILHFISRKAMNITCGEESLELFFKEGLVNNCADLYTLKWEQLASLERWGEKSAKNLVESIQESTNIPYERVLFALGIRYVGETVAKKLAHAFPSIDQLMTASIEELVQVDEIGERIALSVKNHFEEEKHIEIVERLKSYGLQFTLSEDLVSMKTDKLNGLTIVISGSFSLHSRDEYKAMIELNGGKNSGSISGKTNYVLAGENMGPAKLEKAEKLGVIIINEEQFLEMIK